MISVNFIKSLIQETIIEKNFFLVEVKVSSSNKIEVYIDSEKGIRIEDCVLISRLIEGQLDREKEDFALEVSSPGIDQSFKVKEQYLKNINKNIEVLSLEGKKISGKLVLVNDEGFEVEEMKSKKHPETNKKVKEIVKHQFVYSRIKSAKLIIKF